MPAVAGTLVDPSPAEHAMQQRTHRRSWQPVGLALAAVLAFLTPLALSPFGAVAPAHATTTYDCDTNGDGVADAPYACDADGDGTNDSCYACDTDGDGSADACLVCDTDGDGSADACYQCDWDDDGVDDACNCYVCDNDGDGTNDSDYTCDNDGDGTYDSCYTCDTDGDEVNDACYQCDTDGDEVNDACYQCDNDGDEVNDACYTCDTDGDGTKDACYTCDTDDDGTKDACCKVTGISGDEFIPICENATFTASGEGLDCVTWSGGEDPASGTGASYTTKWNTSGEKTVTAACPSGSSKEKKVKVCKVVSLAKEGDACDTNADSIAHVKKADEYVIVKATTDPDEEGAWEKIEWTGGEPVAGAKNKRKVSRGTCGVTEVKAKIGCTEKKKNVVIVWVTFDNFQTAGPKPADSSVQPSVWGVPAAAAQNGCLMRAKVCPINAATFGVTFDIKRTKESGAWVRTAGGAWSHILDNPAGASDDSHNGDEDLTPSAAGYIYSSDNPGWSGAPTPGTERVYTGSFIEFVQMNCDLKCSDDYPWHCRIWAENDGTGAWRRTAGKTNDIATGAIAIGHGATP